MDSNGVWEASKQTLIFIVGLHEEVEVLLGLQREQTQMDTNDEHECERIKSATL